MREMKIDCDQMGQLLEENEGKLFKLDERDVLLRDKEQNFRERKEELVKQEETVRLLKESLERQSKLLEE